METQLFFHLSGAGVLAVAMVAIFRATFFTVQQRTTAVVHRAASLGRHHAMGGMGI